MSIHSPIPTGIHRFHRNLHKIRSNFLSNPIVGMILLGCSYLLETWQYDQLSLSNGQPEK